MLKSVLLVLLFMLNFQSHDEFYKISLNDFKKSSCLIILKIVNNKHENLAIIENDNFFVYLSLKQNINKQNYYENAKSIIENKDLIELNDEEIKKFNFQIISKPKKLERIKCYFNENKVQKKRISDSKRLNLIYTLISLKIPCRFDDETGYLRLLGNISN